jgi:Coenzyme PQQ synthesis protein D (PqqD)
VSKDGLIRPVSRTEGVITEDVGDELLVYDTDSDQACRLNRSAALVWQNCDGHRTVGDLAEMLRAELGDVTGEDMVVVALDHLAEHGLVDGYERREASAARVSRRRFMRRVGVVGATAMAVPVVHSLAVPRPAAAASNGYAPYYNTSNSSLLSR